MAATGTPTPNIGLRIPIGTDPASVDDINYNSNLLDTKLGAVGNDSVQDQIDTLNGKIPTNIRSFADFSVSVPANGSTSFTLPRSGVYLIVGRGDIMKANSVAYIIGGYATASRSRITKLTDEDAITIDGSSTTSFTFGISNNANDVVTLRVIQLN